MSMGPMPGTVEIWNLLLGAAVGSLVTAAAGAWRVGVQLKGLEKDIEALRRDVNRLFQERGEIV